MKYLRRIFLVLLALLVIAAVVASTCPAQFAYRLVADRLGAVKLAGVDGTVWQGHAGSVRLFDTELGALDWQLQAAPLVHGSVLAQLHLQGADVDASGEVERHFDGLLEVRNTTIKAPARVAAPALDIPALQLLGDIEAKIGSAQLRGAWPDSAVGTAQWHDAAVAGAAQAQLGTLEATYATVPDGSIGGVVRDLGGPLQVNGTFKVSAGSYDADATLKSRDGNAQVNEALRYIGEPQADGSSHLVIHGQLFKVF